MSKANNKNTRTTSLFLLLTLKYFTPFSRVSIVDFEQVNVSGVFQDIQLFLQFNKINRFSLQAYMLYGLVCLFIFIIFIFRGQSIFMSVERKGNERKVQQLSCAKYFRNFSLYKLKGVSKQEIPSTQPYANTSH